MKKKHSSWLLLTTGLNTNGHLQSSSRESKCLFWDSACCNTSDSFILYNLFKNIKNCLCSPLDSSLSLSQKDSLISDVAAQLEIFAEHLSEYVADKPLPIVYRDAYGA